MPEIIGIDHIYVSVSDMARSEKFYDVVMEILGFRKNRFQLGAEKHVQYYNRHFGYVLRPARTTNRIIPMHPVFITSACGLRAKRKYERRQAGSRRMAFR